MNIEQFKKEMEVKQDYVNKCLKQYLPAEDTYPTIIHQAIHYAVFNGGKRLRPIMLLEAAEIAGGEQEHVALSACAVELIHSYSLTHDDLPAMDDDDYRRGKPTCHIVFGQANAILTGDALLTLAFELLSKNAENEKISDKAVLKVIGEIAKASGSLGMIAGQVIDIESEGKEIDYQILKKLHQLKTAELFKASLRAGAILSNVHENGLEALTTYADSFGLAFQITDDILDIEGDQMLIGKLLGSDVKNNKITYPSLFGIDESYRLAKESIEKCQDVLSIFDEKADFLRKLAHYLLERKN